MQIQLKQAEIKRALQQYVAQQGIDLAGKSVVITFTSGRKDNGLTADVSIEDMDIPGFTDAVEETVAKSTGPQLGQVMTLPPIKTPITLPVTVETLAAVAAVLQEPAAVVNETKAEVAKADPVVTEDKPAGVATPVVTVAPATTSSLFG